MQAMGRCGAASPTGTGTSTLHADRGRGKAWYHCLERRTRRLSVGTRINAQETPLSLEPFFRPRSVAVIGASSDPKKLGYAVVDNLVNGGYLNDSRQVFPINPKGGSILGQAAYRSVTEVPCPIDLAVIVIPYMLVPDALRTCCEKDIPAAIIISAGFREAGREGLERERELVEISRTCGIRLIGPNCLGVIDTNTPMNASFWKSVV